MAAKKTPVRKVKAKKRATPRKKAVAAKKAPSRLKQVENALMATMAEVDELALDMGLLGAAPPRKKRKTR